MITRHLISLNQSTRKRLQALDLYMRLVRAALFVRGKTSVRQQIYGACQLRTSEWFDAEKKSEDILAETRDMVVNVATIDHAKSARDELCLVRAKMLGTPLLGPGYRSLLNIGDAIDILGKKIAAIDAFELKS